MPTVITLPENYGYVAPAAVSTGFLIIMQIDLVSSSRKKAGIKYPQMYAERSEMESSFDAVKFNCAQRAHQNTLEFIPHVLFLTSFLGLRYPIPAASLTAAWIGGRVVYTFGYITGDPAKVGIKAGGVSALLTNPNMSTTITLPENYGYVALAAISTGFLTLWQTTLVSKARKRSGVKYPQMYAEQAQVGKDPEALKFNCAQRAHQNTLESLPHILLLVPFLGLRYPILAASLGAGWIFGRVLYTLGYNTGDPSKRNSRGGILSSIAHVGLLLSGTYAAGELALGKW
ncbi:hypothetical protein FRC06_004622 [Ceratobasidium sp. 370]|nr:hypothetical protein FRC06_004622 [Ceratobasidium sp. 370]